MVIAGRVLFLVLGCCSMAQEVRTGQLAGRPIELRLVRADDQSPVAWPENAIELTQVPASVTRDSNIYMLLQANGIAPDSGAFSVVYDLNPKVKDVNKLVPNASIRLPIVIPRRALQNLLKNRFLVEITVDPEIRLQLNQRIDDLQRLEPSIGEVTADADTQAQVKSLIGWYQEIEKRFKRKTDPPLRQATLMELRSEADLLSSILEDADQQHRHLADAERQQIAAIYEDIKLEMAHYGQVLAGLAPRGQAFYPVTVILKGVKTAAMDTVRVYYTFNGLFRPLPADPPIRSFEFTHLGSGVSENLLMKNYQIWAAKDGDPNHPLTRSFVLRIDETSPVSLTVELSAIEAKQ
jgi:hypothetical protein